jgi:putative hemolysin
MTVLILIVLIAMGILASYIGRIYSEFGKILPREVQDNLDAWEERVEPHLGLTRDHAALCAAVLEQLALGFIAIDIAVLLFIRPLEAGPPAASEVGEAILAMFLIVVFCNQLISSLVFNRTQGVWAVRFLWLIRLLLWM